MSRKHGSTHHIIPKSRGGPKNKDWNKKENLSEKHSAYHILFANKLPCEAIHKITTRWTTKSGKLDIKKLRRKREPRDTKIDAWKTVSGNSLSPKKMIEIIKKEWTLEYCFQFKECFKFHDPKKVCPVLKLHKKGKLKFPLLIFVKWDIIKAMDELINQLIQKGYLKTPRIIGAFKTIKREDFVPESLKAEADINTPLPIGWGQTISQPLTVAFMLELLQPEPGDKILDIGAGSGWQTALLAYIVGKKGRVFAMERIPELLEFGKKNVEKYKFKTVNFICGDGSKGLEMEAPFDRIIVAASAEKIPEAWKEQLKVGGRLVTPVHSSIWLLIKESEKKFKEQEFPGFAFVPLISE